MQPTEEQERRYEQEVRFSELLGSSYGKRKPLRIRTVSRPRGSFYLVLETRKTKKAAYRSARRRRALRPEQFFVYLLGPRKWAVAVRRKPLRKEE